MAAIIKEGLREFLNKDKLYRVVFGMHSIREFNEISNQSLFWTTIMVHDKFAYKYFNALNKEHR